MFWHNLKYELLSSFRVRDVLFWLMLFPIILGTFFKIAFGGIYDKDFSDPTIKTAVVCVQENQNFSAVLDSLSEGEDKLLKITETSKEEALKMLEDKSVEAIIYVDEKISLEVNESNISTSILERIVNQYSVNERIIMDTLKENPNAVQNVAEMIMSDIDYTEQIKLANKKTDMYDQYFYNLIAMVALFCSVSGLHVAIQNQGNLSSLGARKCISPTSKSVSIMASLTGTYILGIVCVVICVTFVRYGLRINLGDNLLLAYLAAIAGSLLGSTAGFFIGSIGNMSEGTKSGMATGFSMISCFFSGLMMGNIKGEIESKMPFINRINPAAVLSDSIYYITVFDDTKSYWRCIITMLAETALFAVLGILMTRRRKYDSI